jgi:hypothetical protein
MEEKKKKSNLEKWISDGVNCYYARFQSPIPPGDNKEPVSEFTLNPLKNTKYRVDSMVYTPHGLIFKAYGETNIVPLPDVMYARFTL